ncbi:RcnB family protein [Parasphingorhabdus sp.]|uniref:RcnB family protein n=1 Tax=Parasphingorhabdus sp. TaxID=2709688 RepID=UPI003A8DE4EA
MSALCALALLLPASAYAQKHDDRKDRSENTRSESTHNNKKPATKQVSPKTGNKAATPQKSGSSGHKFVKGQRFDRAKASNYRRIDYREHRQLSAPPRGYVWVRAGNDALLVRLSNNLISQIVVGIY